MRIYVAEVEEDVHPRVISMHETPVGARDACQADAAKYDHKPACWTIAGEGVWEATHHTFYTIVYRVRRVEVLP